jgi:hypothetical protein
VTPCAPPRSAPPADTSVELNGVALVRTTTSAQGAANKFCAGYAAELRWQGAFVQDGSSDGFCGRVKRLVFAR